MSRKLCPGRVIISCERHTSLQKPLKGGDIQGNGQERPKDAPERPNPLPNGAQDHPKSISWAFFLILFSYTKFAWIFDGLLFDFCKLESLKIAIFPRKNNDFHKIAILGKNAKNHRKTIPKSFRNPTKIDEKSTKIAKKRPKNTRWQLDGSKKLPKCKK